MIIKGQDNLNTYGKIKIILQDIFTGEIVEEYYNNLIVTVGKTMIAKRLSQTANACNITYGAVGTNVTAPVVGNTTLGTELARNVVSTISYSNNVVNITVFFGASEANGVLKEVGFFGEAATGAANSGTMINHAVINTTKTSAKTMTIEWTFTIA